METNTVGAVAEMLEWCPKCDCQRGVLQIEDEPGEDCNFFEKIKEYKLTQASSKPFTCDCGAVLKLVTP